MYSAKSQYMPEKKKKHNKPIKKLKVQEAIL